MDLSQKKLFVISAPSGSGKTTIFKIAEKAIPSLASSISYTTRLPRPGEVHGKDYFFVDVETFQSMIDADRFIEWATVHGNFYGTSKDNIKEIQAEGKIAILDIDVQGAMQVKKLNYPDTIFIFILPPSIEELENRLVSRATESESELRLRLNNARLEMEYKDQYDYIVVNDNLEVAAKEFIRHIVVESVDLAKTSTASIDTFINTIAIT